MRKQRIRYTAAGLTGVVLVLALTAMVNWLGARHWKRGDWTSTHLYTLSAKTRGVIKDLPEDIRVVVFMTPASNLYDQVHELLERYAALSDKIHVEYIDPDREPLKTRQLAQQFGISAADTVVFSAGDRSKYVTSQQMADYDYSGMQMGEGPKIKGFKGEEQFTAAILSLVAPEVPKIYFVTGHGEATPDSQAGHTRSLGQLAEAIKRDNMSTAELSLLGGTIPKDAAALAIIGPTTAFAEPEIKLLTGYVAKGGRLLVCLDPLIDRDGTMKTTRLEPFLASYGVDVGNDLVIDPSHRLPFFDLSAVYLTDFRPSPVTQGLEGMAVLFPVARSLAAGTVKGYTDTPLVETSDKGWGETDLAKLVRGEAVSKDDKDLPGPVAVAMTVEPAKPAPGAPGEDKTAKPADDSGMRMAVFGDSDFLTDGQIANAGNMTLALNAFAWLGHREQTLGIAPREVEQVNLFLTGHQLTMILLITLLFMPGAAIVAGIVVWRRRRH